MRVGRILNLDYRVIEMKASRVQFSGFQLVENQDTDRFDIETGTVQDGGVSFALTLLRPAGTDMNFSTGEVKTAGRTVWKFRDAGFTGPALLVRCGERLVIALVGRDSRKVEQVVPLAKLVGKVFDLTAIIRLKQLAAEQLGRECILTELEQKVAPLVARQTAKADALRRAQLAGSTQKVSEGQDDGRALERQRRIDAIMARPRVVGYSGGQKRFGVPVVGDEWQVLKNDTFVILVESIGKDGTIGALIESFVVTRKGRGSEASKAAVVPVSAEPPRTAAKQAQLVKPVGEVAVEHEQGIYSVLLFGSMDDIRAAQAAGLNSGPFAAVNRKDDKGRYEVVSVHHNKIDTVGKLTEFAV